MTGFSEQFRLRQRQRTMFQQYKQPLIYRFGVFQLDVQAGDLRKSGEVKTPVQGVVSARECGCNPVDRWCPLLSSPDLRANRTSKNHSQGVPLALVMLGYGTLHVLRLVKGELDRPAKSGSLGNTGTCTDFIRYISTCNEQNCRPHGRRLFQERCRCSRASRLRNHALKFIQ